MRLFSKENIVEHPEKYQYIEKEIEQDNAGSEFNIITLNAEHVPRKLKQVDSEIEILKTKICKLESDKKYYMAMYEVVKNYPSAILITESIGRNNADTQA